MKKVLIIISSVLLTGVIGGVVGLSNYYNISVGNYLSYNTLRESVKTHRELFTEPASNDIVSKAEYVRDFILKYYEEANYTSFNIRTYKGSEIREETLKTLSGFAYGMNSPEVEIWINTEEWDNFSTFDKYELLRHELMHDLYNREHVNDSTDIMYHGWSEDATNKKLISDLSIQRRVIDNAISVAEKKQNKPAKIYNKYNNILEKYTWSEIYDKYGSDSYNYFQIKRKDALAEWKAIDKDIQSLRSARKGAYDNYIKNVVNYWEDKVKSEGLDHKLNQ